MRDKIIGLASAMCLGLLVLVFVGSSACVETSQDTPVPGSPTAPTATARPSCLTLIEPVGNTVCGYIFNEHTGKPVVKRPVYLAKALFSSDNSVVLSSLNKNRAPQGVTDKNGMFYVTNVPSDMYFLMLDDYPKPIMMQEPDNPANDLFVDWRESTGPVDLGVIPVRVVTPDPSE
ncbi:MAG: hypothetical protein ACFFA6_13340 [Promethearchaeota archaeon]